ncbi:unnamed protein product [Arabis nemorensis]|uniref:DNA ligase ATP-dependent N-terminal domain-containing protein n=1 Tax=Arabis nemorensis TaxID=586526 RepID=A0A565CG12_9BRAS|nr:unnamed protein product [Arabis nemorensis]
MLRTIIVTTPEDLVATVYLAANEIQGELGIGKGSIIKAISEAFGNTEAEIVEKIKELGELGLVAKRSRSSQAMIYKPQPLTIVKVFNTFRQIAKESGKGSKEKKQNRMKEVFVATTDCEALYLTRLLQAKLRLKFTGQTVLAALGQAAAANIVKQVVSVVPAYDTIVHALPTGGVWNLPKACIFTLGVPISPMLAKPAKSVGEILDKFQDTVFTCEYKYDGQRKHSHSNSSKNPAMSRKFKSFLKLLLKMVVKFLIHWFYGLGYCLQGTGFSEAELEERSSNLGSKVIPTPKKCYQVGDSLKPEPDVWFEPTEQGRR